MACLASSEPLLGSSCRDAADFLRGLYGPLIGHWRWMRASPLPNKANLDHEPPGPLAWLGLLQVKAGPALSSLDDRKCLLGLESRDLPFKAPSIGFPGSGLCPLVLGPAEAGLAASSESKLFSRWLWGLPPPLPRGLLLIHFRLPCSPEVGFCSAPFLCCGTPSLFSLCLGFII